LGWRLSLMARKELTKSKAHEYEKASKKEKGVILDRICEDTGWSRDNARRVLKACLKAPKHKRKASRRQRSLKYSKRSIQILANAWVISSMCSGMYLKSQIDSGLLGRLCKHEELRDGLRNKGNVVEFSDPAIAEIKEMSSATIDRYLCPQRRALHPLSKPTTKRSNYPLRNEIPFGRSYRQEDKRPGYLSTDTVAHCGHSLKGEHLWTLNSTDVYTGWTETITIKNKARVWIIEGHNIILDAFPFPVIAINYDGGSEFINYEMINYSKLHNYQMTRSRPYTSNDNAHVEQRNGDIVRRYALRYRYEGKEAEDILNALWYYVNLLKNFLVPCRKCIGHTKTKSGRTRGIYDKPKTPFQRVMECDEVSLETKEHLAKIYASLNDAAITRKIAQLQTSLLTLITDKNMIDFIKEKVDEAA